MKNFENLKAILESFEKNRKLKESELENLKKNLKDNKSYDDQQFREDYAKEIADCFNPSAEMIKKGYLPCAAMILAGHFRVTNNVQGQGKELIRNIYPTAIELYYHEEDNGTDNIRFKDPIMYHTTDRKLYDYFKNEKYFNDNFKDCINNEHFDYEKALGTRNNYFSKRHLPIAEIPYEIPYFPVGSLNPHTSGIDITFENPDKKYRASCLIREYQIKFGGEEKENNIENSTDKKIENSTDIYDDMLICGIPLDNNVEWIEWVDDKDKSIETTQLDPSPRKNVCAYEKYNDYPELWQKIVKKENGVEVKNSKGKPVFEACPFNWQFRIKIPMNKK